MFSRDVSDHCPLVLKVESWDWAPKSFHFNKYWLENRNFKCVVEAFWRDQVTSGWMGFIWKEKLKNLMFKFKKWSKEEYGGMKERVE